MRQPRETTLFVWGAIVLTVAFFLVWYIVPIGWTWPATWFWGPSEGTTKR